MFKVSGNDYPIGLSEITNTTGFFYDQSRNYDTASIFVWQEKYNNIVETGYQVNGTTVTITNNNPISVILSNGNILTPAQDINNIGINEFYYSNGDLILGASYTGTLIVLDYPENYGNNIPTTYLAPPHPSLYSEYVIEGVISYKRTFKGHPSTEFTFTTFKYNQDVITNDFLIGKIKTINSINYQITSLSISELSSKKYPQNLIVVSVSLTGQWDSIGDKNILDRPISLKQIITNYPSDKLGYNSLSDLFNCLGVPHDFNNNSYSNIAIPDSLSNKPRIKIASDVDSNTTTTLRQELESRAITVKGFPFYSDDAVKIKRWDKTGGYPIAERDILNEQIDISVTGNSYPYQGVQLVKELWNAKVELSQETDEEIGNENYILWEYENAYNEYDVTHAVDPVYDRTTRTVTDYRPMSPNVFRNATGNFDSGGITKTMRKRTFKNGSEVTTEEWTYGFNFICADTYLISVNPPRKYEFNLTANIANLDTYWMLVKYKITEKGYDPTPNELNNPEWYLTLETSNGWQYLRLAQESEVLETAKSKLDYANGDITLSEYNKIKEKYIAIKKPFDPSVTEYELEKLSNYYDDIPKPIDNDNTFIFPRFVKRKITTQTTTEVKVDPTATEDNPKPDIYVESVFKQFEETKILTPLSIDSKRRKPEIFEISSYTIGKQNDTTRNEISVIQNAGRPSIHETLNPTIKPFSEILETREDLRNKTLFLNSPNSNKDVNGYNLRLCGEIESETISYPDIVDKNEILDIAKVDLAIQNIDSVTLTLKLGKKYPLAEGDVVLWRLKYWVIKDITEVHSIQRNRVNLDEYSLTLGRYFPTIPIALTEVENGN